uniref:Putative capsid protein n=1 Tax=viral metagenome TaxID=1070528 RepID=A0A6H1ZIY1_9ZZZZ
MATATTYSPSTVTYSHREDLEDLITNISPTDTVFMSNISKTKVKAKYHR